MSKSANRRFYPKLLLTLFLWAGLSPAATAKNLVLKTEANVMVELTFNARRAYADPFNEITLDVIFIDPRGRELRVPGFWAGTNLWKVRYASPLVGIHRFRSVCSEPRDRGLHHISGQVEVDPYHGSNPLYEHGPLRVSENRRFLEHADSTPFFWLGDTWWMGLCHRLHWPEEFKTLAADRKEKGFNLIQIVAGLYPDMPPFDPRGANEAGYPWETNYARIRPEYFNAADARLEYLVEEGFTPCIVGAWGYFLPMMGIEKAKQHWRNLIARYGALPVVWCVAGEANLPYYRAKGFPYDDREQVHGWTEVTRYVRRIDPFHRPVTIHPTGLNRLSARHAIDDASLLDIDMLQTPHGRSEAVAPTIHTVRESYADKPTLPVIDGEASYEMLNNNIPAAWPRAMFWICMLNGAAGHTYGANGIWQCNRKGQPHGPSPTAGSPPTGYGTISWDEAMNLPGSRQVGLGKKLLEAYPWQRFTPHPEWVEMAVAATLNLSASQWIWFPEGNPAVDAPAEKRFLRKTFALPAGKTIASARLFAAADDSATITLNGTKLNSSGEWLNGREFNDLVPLCRQGSNILAAVVQNQPAPVPRNPAGFFSILEIRFTDGEVTQIVSDKTWRSAKANAPGWETLDFDDASWSSAMTLGHNGAPWRNLGDPRKLQSPQAAGVPNIIRVFYVPRPEPIRILHLANKQSYRATYFDPVSGAKTPFGAICGDDQDSWTCPPPANVKEQDWVVLLEPLD